jgi:hypothetical protein
MVQVKEALADMQEASLLAVAGGSLFKEREYLDATDLGPECMSALQVAGSACHCVCLCRLQPVLDCPSWQHILCFSLFSVVDVAVGSASLLYALVYRQLLCRGTDNTC